MIAQVAEDGGYTMLKGYEANRDLITQVKNYSGTNTFSQYDYVNDAIGRRESVVYSGHKALTQVSLSRFIP